MVDNGIIYTSSTRTRRGGSCLKDIYKTFLIYRTCMRRAPAKPVRACTLRKWCPVSHVTFEAPRHTSHLTVFTLHTAPFAINTSLHTVLLRLHTSHFTLHSSHSKLHTSQSTLHTALFALQTSHFTVHTSHFSLLTASFTLQTSHCILHAPHLTLHSSHPTLHLIWALLTLSQLSSSHLISSCHLSFHESLPSTTTKELACAVRQPGPCARALCEAVAMLLSKNMTCARPRCNATWSKHFPHTSHCTLHTSHLSSFHLVSCLPICQLRSSWLFSCHLSAAQTFSCVGPTFNLSRRFCTSARLSVTHVDSSTCQKA